MYVCLCVCVCVCVCVCLCVCVYKTELIGQELTVSVELEFILLLNSPVKNVRLIFETTQTVIRVKVRYIHCTEICRQNDSIIIT
jgi:hypothetical protein